MSSWGNNDNAANSPLWGASTINLAPTTTNRTSAYENATANVGIGGQTVGIYGVDANEQAAAGAGNHPSHSGWIRRSVGQGGRTARIQNEVLVALSSVLGDTNDSVFVDATITIASASQSPAPVLQGPDSASANTANVTVIATSAPSSATANQTYYWQFNSASGSLGWANTSGNTRFTANTSSTLLANAANTMANTWVVRCVVNVPGGVAKTSGNTTIWIV